MRPSVLLPLLVLLLSGSLSVTRAQLSLAHEPDCKPPKTRELFHDYIDAQQRTLLRSDGSDDAMYAPSRNEEVNFLLTRVARQQVDAFQCRIEKDSTLKDQVKVRYLRGMENVLRFFIANTGQRKVRSAALPDVITAYERCVEADKNGTSIEEIIRPLSWESGFSVMRADNTTFERNPGFRPARDLVVLKYCTLYPARTFATLNEYPDVFFADSLIRAVARRYPRQLYDYAQASNKLGDLIRSITDNDFIRTVVRMARSRDGQQYFCFLDNILSGRLTLEEVDAAKGDSVAYYRLLVRTRMDYVRRALDRDTAFEMGALTDRLEQKAKEYFVNTINALHNEPAEQRFRCIQELSPEELYYLAVSSDGSIYTSSFVKGVYPLMMRKANNRGDSLLLRLHFDRYRKFIKMTAGYNMLGNFLGSFPSGDGPDGEREGEVLMRAFVSRLEQGDGLEDGVDVADSYASIAESLQPLAADIVRNVQANFRRNEASGNKRGMAIYRILDRLFQSADSTRKVDLTAELGIPPVYDVPYSSLINDSGRVIVHVFFYGDKDGQAIFKGFLGMFANANWKTDVSHPQWVVVQSAKGRPVVIYANRPLPEESGEDEKAQAALSDHLEKSGLQPAITIHRGHSYYAPYTIRQMFPSSRIVFLGSCGGYHLIHDVLEKAPDAHIIASKQIGATEVNRPFFQLLTEKIRNGIGVEWVPFWKELGKIVTAKEFEDYIPPYKNLGALFIKAYKIAMETAEEGE